MHILLVDDDCQHQEYIKTIVSSLNHEITAVGNGQEAVEFCQQSLPDLIFMDIIMPVMNSVDCVAALNKLFPNSMPPVIMMSMISEFEQQVAAYELGALDYLPKPVDIRLLSQKIKTYARLLAAEQRLVGILQEKEKLLSMHLQEEEMAKQVLETMSQRYSSEQPTDVEVYSNALAKLNGDIVITKKGPANNLFVMILDATGHGLPAAITLLPAIDVFNDMVAAGYMLPKIIAAINEKTHLIGLNGRFLAATFLRVDRNNKLFELWSAANPPAIFCHQSNKLPQVFRMSNIPLGAESSADSTASFATCTYHWQTAGSLLMYTDGVTDSVNSSGSTLALEGLLRIIAEMQPVTESNLLPQLLQKMRHHGYEKPTDDMTLVAVHCP